MAITALQHAPAAEARRHGGDGDPGAVCFPRRVAELLRAGLDLRDRHAANERLAQHLWAHRDQRFTFLRQPGLDATNWRDELAIRFGVILRRVWGGSRTWPGARAQTVLMSVWRTCWKQRRSALDCICQLLRGTPVILAT
jgi:transposase